LIAGSRGTVHLFRKQREKGDSPQGRRGVNQMSVKAELIAGMMETVGFFPALGRDEKGDSPRGRRGVNQMPVKAELIAGMMETVGFFSAHGRDARKETVAVVAV